MTPPATRPPATRLPARARIGYSLGSLTSGAFGTVPGLILLPYLTDNLGVGAGLAGALVLLPKFWDVVFNPVAGRLSDRKVSKAGPRRPFVLAGGVVAGLLFAAIFAAPFGTGSLAPTWVTVTFLLCATAYAFFQVPWSAMPAEITSDYGERTRIMTLRIALLAVAILISGAVAPLVANTAADAIAGHRLMGGLVGAIMIIGAVSAFAGTRHAPTGAVTESEPSLRAQFAVARRNTPFLALFACFVIQGTGIATMLAGVNYFAGNVLGDDTNGPTLLFAAFVGPAILVMPLWSTVGNRLGKARGLVISSLVFAVGGLAIGAVAWLDLPAGLAYGATALVGVGYAGEQVFALAMLADCIAVDTARTGRAQGGVFAGLWTGGETLGFALGPGIFALFLQFSGYLSTTGDTAVLQPDGVRTGVILGFSVAPALLVAAGLVLMRFYTLERVTGPGGGAPRP